MQDLFFYLVAGLTGLCAIAVVVTQNIVRSAAYLLFTLGGVAAVFFLLGADFVGATQLLVYVGGTLVLVVFGVMLTAQGPFISMKTGAVEWAVATFVGLLLFGTIVVSLVSQPLQFETRAKAKPGVVGTPGPVGPGREDQSELTPEESRTTLELGQALLDYTKGGYAGMPVAAEGGRTRMGYLLPFEIVSVHLLVVLIGAAYLARAKRRRRAE